MNQKILSQSELEWMDRELTWFGEHVEQFYIDFEKTIQAFESAPVTESFYGSGEAGQETKEYLITLRNAVKQYVDNISGIDGLIPVTKKYIVAQQNLLSMKGATVGATVGAMVGAQAVEFLKGGNQ